MNKSRLTAMGQRIHAGMAASGVTTVADLARRAKVSRQTAARWLYEPEATPSAPESFRLGDALRMSARWLVTGEGCPTPREPILPNEHRLLDRYRRMDESRRSILLHAADELTLTQ